MVARVPTDPKRQSWYAHLPKTTMEQKGKVINPFKRAIEAARKTALAHHGFEKPTPNHPNPHEDKVIDTWAQVYKRNRPTADKNEIKNMDFVRQKPKRKGKS